MPTIVWHSDQLPHRFPDVHTSLNTILKKHGIAYQPITQSRDIWCRDYMPVRSADGSLVQFVYWPRYLRSANYADRITTPGCYGDLPFTSQVSESVIILDGGGVEISGKTGIVTEQVFKDNYWYPREELAAKLKVTLKLDKLIVIPIEQGDVTGHVDGVVRFINEKRVMMNDYSLPKDEKSSCSAAYGRKVERILQQSGLQVELIPYAPTDNLGPDGMPVAIGCYINFLRIDNLVILPQFEIAEDLHAVKECKRIFGEDVTVEPVDCSELAWDGGVLNCVSWC